MLLRTLLFLVAALPHEMHSEKSAQVDFSPSVKLVEGYNNISQICLSLCAWSTGDDVGDAEGVLCLLCLCTFP